MVRRTLLVFSIVAPLSNTKSFPVIVRSPPTMTLLEKREILLKIISSLPVVVTNFIYESLPCVMFNASDRFSLSINLLSSVFSEKSMERPTVVLPSRDLILSTSIV